MTILTLTLLILNYFTSIAFFWLTCDCSISSVNPLRFLGQANINTGHAMTTGILVLGFKIAKDWIAKQKENQRLINLKISHEIKMQKANIYPNLLFQSLNSLYHKMILDPANSPETILRLSELLSYLLYESSEKLISLEKELNMITNLISLEKLNQTQPLTIHSKVNSNTPSMFIKPLILFPFLQNCFDIMGARKEHHIFHLEISTKEQTLYISLVIGEASKKSIQIEWSGILQSIEEKLNKFRNDIHSLRIENQEEQCKILFALELTTNP